MKKIFLLTASAALLVLAASCAITKVWDETYPLDRSATVWFHRIRVKSYNGISVKNWYSVVLPAGEATIGGDVSITHANITFGTRDMEFTCHLEAEKEYSISGAASDGLWGVNLYEGRNLSAKPLVFIPFKSQPNVFR